MTDSALVTSDSSTRPEILGATIYKLRPDEVMRYWCIIEMAIREAHVPTVQPGENEITKLQEDLVNDNDAEVWIGTNDQGLPCAVAVVVILTQPTGEKNALIFALYGIENLTIQLFGIWAIGFLKHFQRRGMTKLIAYTNQSGVVALATRLGAHADFTLLEWRLQDVR